MKHEEGSPERPENDPDPIRRRMDPEGKRAYDLMFSKHYILTATIFVTILGNLVVFVGLGYLIDLQFETKPVFLLIGFVISFISTQLCLFKKFKKFQ
jgi:F0F1-type ATP synthase assembly protein I